MWGTVDVIQDSPLINYLWMGWLLQYVDEAD